MSRANAPTCYAQICKPGTAEELWSKYMQLTEAEASFRALKSELSIRPSFHQREPRVKANSILIIRLLIALALVIEQLYRLRYLHRGEHGVRSAIDLHHYLWLTWDPAVRPLPAEPGIVRTAGRRSAAL